MDRQLIEGKTVAVVGCGTSACGKGWGSFIDSQDVVIRCNRSYMTAGLEHDYGSKMDALVIGNPRVMMRLLPRDLAVPVVAVRQDWNTHRAAWEASTHLDLRMPPDDALGTLWTHRRKPLAGTYAALYAAALGARCITLVGVDLYTDGVHKTNSWSVRIVFPGHQNRPPARGAWDLSLDRNALLRVPCPLTWLPAPPSPSSPHA